MVTSTTDEETTETKLAEEKLELGKPLNFSTNEKHSFQEWLQLSRIQPIVREKEEQTNSNSLNETQKKKLELINKFIETNPKIPAVKSETTSNATLDLNKEDHSMLMTETLAKVYLEQKKYQKAIQAYEILILKYPEKISFFADRISDIKILQQNNNN
jgi:virulence-associated protein VapD